MAARFWRCVLGLALLIALIAAAVLAAAWSLAPLATLGLGLLILLAEPLLFVLTSTLMARAAAPRQATAQGAGPALRTWVSETVHFSRAMLAMSRDPPPLPPADASQQPVLLIHGILCNRGVWGALRGRLHAEGFAAVAALNLEPLLADIELQATRARSELLALHQRCHGARVSIVAHSMGGLVARVLLRDLGPSIIGRIITLATPHHGTCLAPGLPWPATRQLACSSPWLRTLNGLQEGRCSVPLLSLYSLEDNLVVPAQSARLQGAEWQELRGVGHLAMVSAPAVLDRVMAVLRGAATP